jgi:tripartite-type tricarboxylate transporter receptor subunit TctC
MLLAWRAQVEVDAVPYAADQRGTGLRGGSFEIACGHPTTVATQWTPPRLAAVAMDCSARTSTS